MTSDNPDPRFLIQSPADRLREQEAQDRRQEKKERRQQLWFNGIVAAATVLGFIASSYQGCILYSTLTEIRTQSQAAIRSADASEKALRLTQEMFQQDQVPYLTVHDLSFRDLLTVGAPVSLDMKILNGGKSAALHTTWRLFAQFGPAAYRKVESLRNLSEPASSMTVAAGQSVPFLVESLRDPLQPNGPTMPWDGSWPVLVFGNFRYRDSFKKPHAMRFCFEAPSRTRAWTPCAIHNEVD